MDRTRLLLLPALACAALLAARPAVAQLISPGKLTETHAEWEGIRNCTQCHELRKPGIADSRCLTCHEPLRARIERKAGYHADVGADCAQCHKEHFGRDFELVRFEPAEFDHNDVGFELVEAHARLECDECHSPTRIRDRKVRAFKGTYGAMHRTYLGLATTCLDCHSGDSPHEGQFDGQQCRECHSQTVWEEAEGFSHDNTRYRLTGRHRTVACEGCHREQAGPDGKSLVSYAPLAFGACTSCHTDQHAGEMGSSCTDCHSTRGWGTVDRGRFEGDFDHAQTGYALSGSHVGKDCMACHGESGSGNPTIRIAHTAGSAMRSYPRPIVDGCLSCHVDQHSGAFVESPGGSTCDSCHGDSEWLPTRYDLFRHNQDAGYVLSGAHMAVPCAGCHEPGDEADISSAAAAGAASSDASGDAADAGSAPTWFTLDASSCLSCHTGDDPHQSQFADRTCDACHSQDAFSSVQVDHSATRYPLDGAHAEVPCASCHTEEKAPNGGTFVRYKPLETECRACHAS